MSGVQPRSPALDSDAYLAPFESNIMRTLNVRCRTPVSLGRDILVLSPACFLSVSGLAQAQEPTVAPVDEESPKSTPATPPPYSPPWQLRPVAPANVVRLDLPISF
jgi:hypothetical protein